MSQDMFGHVCLCCCFAFWWKTTNMVLTSGCRLMILSICGWFDGSPVPTGRSLYVGVFCFGGDIFGTLCRVLMTPGFCSGRRVGVKLLPLSAIVLSHYCNAKRAECLLARPLLWKCWMAWPQEDKRSLVEFSNFWICWDLACYSSIPYCPKIGCCFQCIRELWNNYWLPFAAACWLRLDRSYNLACLKKVRSTE